MPQEEVSVKRARRGEAVDVAAPPHGHPAVRVKEIRIGPHERIGVVLELLGDIGHVLISVPDVPDGGVDVECPAGIVVEALPVAVPAVTRILVENLAGAVAVKLADNLGLMVIAEYVENEKQRETLHEYGCDLYQGYLFSAAVPVVRS